LTQTPRQMRARDGDPDAAPRRPVAPEKRASRRPPPRRQVHGLSRPSLFAGMIVVFVAGLFAAPFAQYYLGPRLAELSGITDLAAGGSDAADFSRLRSVEQRTEQLSRTIDSIARPSNDAAATRVGALEGEIALLRREIAALTNLTERTTALESSTASLTVLESRLAGLESRPATGDDAAIATVNTRLADVDATLAAVRGESARLANTVDALQRKLAEDLQNATALVESRLDALGQSRGAERSLVDAVDSLKTRADALEETVERSAGRSALVVALGSLRAAAERGRPFDAELRSVRALAVTLQAPQLDDPLNRLAESAGTGLPSLVGLQRSFAALAGRAARSLRSGDGGWVDQTFERMTSLVTVRRTGDISGATPEAVVARAEILLNDGDLLAAVAEVAALEGRGPETDAWLRRARLRLVAERALDDLAAQVVAISGAG